MKENQPSSCALTEIQEMGWLMGVLQSKFQIKSLKFLARQVSSCATELATRPLFCTDSIDKVHSTISGDIVSEANKVPPYIKIVITIVIMFHLN